MANSNETTAMGPLGVVFGEVQKHWTSLLILGIIFLILGVIGLSMTLVLTLASVFFLGVLLLIGGGSQLYQSFFKCKGWRSILVHLVIALLYVFAGIITILNRQPSNLN